MKLNRLPLATMAVLGVAALAGCSSSTPYPADKHRAAPADGPRPNRTYNPQTERFEQKPPFGERSNQPAPQ